MFVERSCRNYTSGMFGVCAREFTPTEFKGVI